MMIKTCQGSEGKRGQIPVNHRSFKVLNLWELKVQPGIILFHFNFSLPFKIIAVKGAYLYIEFNQKKGLTAGK